MRKNKKFSHFYLKNGIETVVYPIKEVRAVAIYLGMNAGSSIEKSGDIGTLHFLEHMMFRGSRKYPKPRDVALREEELGLSANAWVGTLDTRFWFLTPDNRLDESLEYVSDTLTEPSLSPDSVENSRRVILSEQRDFWDVPENLFYYKFLSEMFGKQHLYIRRGFGERKVVEKMTRDKVSKFYKKYYLPKNFKLSLAGNINVGKARKLVENTLGNWEREGEEIGDFHPESVPLKSNYFVYHQMRKQVNFRLTFPILGFKQYSIKERLVLGIFNFLIGGGLTSILYQRLREELGIVYDIWSGRSLWPYLGIFGVGGIVDSENLGKVTTEIFKILRKVKSGGFEEKDFRRAVKYMNTQSLVNFSEASRISSYFLRHMLDGLGIFLPEDYNREANKLKLNDVNRLAEEILDYKRVNFGLMGNKSLISKSGVRNSFEKLSFS